MTSLRNNGGQHTKKQRRGEGWIDRGTQGPVRVFIRPVQSGAEADTSSPWQKVWRVGRWVLYAFFIVAWFGIIDQTVRTSVFPDWARDALYGRSEDPRRAFAAQWAYRTVLYAPFIILSYYAHQWWLTQQRAMKVNVMPALLLPPPPRAVRLRPFALRRGGQFLARWAVVTATIYFLLLTGVALPLYWIHHRFDLVRYFEYHPLRFVLLSPAIASVLLVLIEQGQHWMEANEERTLALAQEGIIIQASVVGMYEVWEWDGEESNFYYRLQYAVNGASPQEPREVNVLKEQWRLLKVGDSVALVHLPDHPDHVQIAAEVARWVR